MKNEIKSVEPTLLGWPVCLWCYPPFNAFFQAPRLLHYSHNSASPAWLHVVILCVITCLWGILFGPPGLPRIRQTWTNRGIVRSGPYQYASPGVRGKAHDLDSPGCLLCPVRHLHPSWIYRNLRSESMDRKSAHHEILITLRISSPSGGGSFRESSKTHPANLF